MSSLTAQHAAYRRGEVLAATPGRLVVLLYDGARRFLRQAALALEEGQIERSHNALRRAERIIASLDNTLDFDQGEVAERLHAIYGFCLRHLNDARFAQDPARVEEVAELLGELREAWVQVAAEVERA